MSGGKAGLPPLQGDQALAVSPADQVWLSASAGTGKTQVLTARVFRLLLEPGVNPDAILCLTFTKAGASEMANRINAQLAAWVRMSDTALGADLLSIGASVDGDTLIRARRLFARVLDAPQGGLRIQTIHSFCQSLLASFPEEAGLAPGFRPIEDRDRIQLARDTLGEMLVDAGRRGDTRLSDNLEALSLKLGAEATESFLMRCAAKPDAMDALVGDIRPYINAALGLKRDEDGSGLAAMCSDALFDIANLEALQDSNVRWGTKTGLEVAAKIQSWLDMDDLARLENLDLVWLAVAKADGDPRKWESFSAKVDPDYAEKAESLYSDLSALKEHIALIGFSGDFARALEVGRDFAWRFAEAKRQAGLLDFDDLIRAAADLLSGRTMAQWIAFKLDQRFDHVLVDEAQDTNPSQWAIVKGLIDDYFSGQGSKADRFRTLFTVGDFKQAIFGFQGTSPQYYAAARLRIGAQAETAGQPFLDLSLDRSFRSTQPVLDMVDAVLGDLGPAALGIMEDGLPLHEGRKGPGVVELWRPIGEGLEDQDESGEGEDAEEWLSGADRKFAQGLAERIAGWLNPGSPTRLWLERRSDGKPGWAGAGDIMVLLRRRGDLASLIVARLYAEGVPVAGIDRLRLGQPLAVQDLIAAIRFALQPLDDLTCAALLVSPLGGWTQDELLAHGYRPEKRALWPHLRDLADHDPALREKLEPLYAILGMADFGTPYDFLEQVLTGPIQGRAKLVARLGEESLDPIAELLALAQKFAASHDGGLQAFLHWFDAGDEEIKRELAGQSDMVRVMTVHGSKGLQAPVVILADACVDPTRKVDSSFDWPVEILGRDAQITLPVYSLPKAQRIGPLAEAHDVAREADMQEHWRLLYVAMTRAAERLYVGGTLGKKAKEPPKESWYAAIERSFMALGCDWLDMGEGPCRRFGSDAVPIPRADEPQAVEAASAESLPDWALRPARPEQRPPIPLAPSSLGKDDVASPPLTGPDRERAAQRGLIMHSLFERLPALAPEQRKPAARRWLARQHGITDLAEADAIIDPVCAVIDHPGFADVFREDALAEAPIAAVVGPNVVSGTVDRLLVEESRVLVVDFKTGRRPPASLEQLPVAHVRQMAAYVAALRLIFPGRTVQAGLLYTSSPRLFLLPDELLAATKLD
ncbi:MULTISPECIES: double-strand break repair helicase AddA [Pseudomonadota]|uniref:double-strand break repair helicase AddA n=2 Tax=Pseudomonadota TaxID=1224 RepID=UPI000769AD49|nr:MULTISPECIES: double-strand break repair helicase AddA [Pseudomonadota]MAF62707.1 double-strand break repair helicase AddA [Blastomonas sp.]|tara:strand:+ start:11854 stop:15312 length:3459 start_codon:yes stop_codon:yes gene_type:complete